MYVRTTAATVVSGLRGLGDGSFRPVARYPRLGRGLGDAAAVQAQIVAAANQYGVDPNLALAVAKQESGYQQTGSGGGTLTSSAGALGVMQLMPSTAAALGVNPNDQTQNINGGVKLLSQLLSQFGGNTSEALAAYNAGPAAVQKYGGVPPYPETQNYVSSILANYQPGAADSYPTGTAAAADSYPTGNGFDFSSLLSSLPGSDSSYDIGGVVLSGSDLFTVGIAALAVLLVSAII